MYITLVASELLGAYKNGGIGTATSHLACLLARKGHEVRVIYTGLGKVDFYHPWIRRLQRDGVTIVHLDVHQQAVFPAYLRESTAIFDYLRNLESDLIIFQDWRGGAFACINARNAGIAFDQTRLAVIAHGPTEWLLGANRTVVRDNETLAHIHMERMVFNAADTVICPSQYMRNWIGNNFQPKELIWIPLYLWSDAETDNLMRRTQPIANVNSLAFFGRLEQRKGIELFLRALLDDRLAFSKFKIFFLGKEATRTESQIRNFVHERRPWLSAALHFETDLDGDQAQNLLVRENCLAIIPSLVDNAPCVISECLRRNIPFVSTNTGGIPELINPEEHDRILFQPTATALADRLCEALAEPFHPAEAAYEEKDIAKRWLSWVTQAARRRAKNENFPGEIFDLAIILTHFERPRLVEQTLASLAVQTRTDFEVVLVDDGSQSQEALRSLSRIENGIWPFPLRVLRRSNGYLGAARNAGIKATEANRLIFMDDDNIAFPDLVEVLIRAQTESNADIVTCQMAIFREKHAEPDLELLRVGERWCFTGGPVELGLSVNCFGDATGIYKREIFDHIGYFHEQRGVGHEDWHLHARAALFGFKHLPVPLPLYWYRRVEGGMLHTTDQYENNKIIWDCYRSAMPINLSRLVDLSLRNELFG